MFLFSCNLSLLQLQERSKAIEVGGGRLQAGVTGGVRREVVGAAACFITLISICPAHGAVASGAPHRTHGPLSSVSSQENQPLSWIFNESSSSCDSLFLHCPLSAASDSSHRRSPTRQWLKLERSFSHEATRGLCFSERPPLLH